MLNVKGVAINRGPDTAARGGLHAALALAALSLAVIVLYRDTAASMFDTWLAHDTYQYGLVVLPIFFWLVWRQRAALLAAPWQPGWWAVPCAAVSAGLWFLGELGGARVLSQVALVLMFVSCLVALFGWARARLVLFPLYFVFFSVPFGEEVVPTLMDWTADATVVALKLSGVPVYREGLWFILPSGEWSVVEACSGVKFLLTSIVVGSLFSYLTYRSISRRIAFLASAVLAAVLANWLRAYLIVLIGHWSDNRLMGNQDHLVFGWVLYGMVVVALLAVGSRYAEPVDVAPATNAESAAKTAGPKPALAAASALAAVSFWPWLAEPLDAGAPPDVVPIQRVVAANGWTESTDWSSRWSPTLVGPRHVLVQQFVHGAARVELHAGVFEHQRKGAEVATSVNRLVLDADPFWRLTGETLISVNQPGLPPRVRSARLRAHHRSYAVWQWMVSAGTPTVSLFKGKTDVVRSRLLGQPDRAYWVAILVPVDDAAPDQADRVLRQFAADMGPALAHALGVAP